MQRRTLKHWKSLTQIGTPPKRSTVLHQQAWPTLVKYTNLHNIKTSGARMQLTDGRELQPDGIRRMPVRKVDKTISTDHLDEPQTTDQASGTGDTNGHTANGKLKHNYQRRPRGAYRERNTQECLPEETSKEVVVVSDSNVGLVAVPVATEVGLLCALEFIHGRNATMEEVISYTVEDENSARNVPP